MVTPGGEDGQWGVGLWRVAYGFRSVLLHRGRFTNRPYITIKFHLLPWFYFCVDPNYELAQGWPHPGPALSTRGEGDQIKDCQRAKEADKMPASLLEFRGSYGVDLGGGAGERHRDVFEHGVVP